MILTAACEVATRSASTARSEGTACAEQRRKEIAKAGIIATKASGVFEALTPVRRRTEFLAFLPARTQLIVSGPLLRILEHFIRFLKFLKFFLGLRFLAHIRMIFLGQFSIGALNFVLIGRALDTHDLVIVFEVHDAGM